MADIFGVNNPGIGGLDELTTAEEVFLTTFASYYSNIYTASSDYTATSTDHIILADASTSAFTVTLPTAVGITGREYIVKKIDSTTNIVTIATTGSETIDGDASFDLELKDESVNIFSNGSNWYII